MSAATAWMDAEKACFDYLLDQTNSRKGQSGFRGDALPAYQMNLWAFSLSGGGTQTQNFQVQTPACQWLMDGQLIGQWLDRDEAMTFAGLIMNQMPAYKNTKNANNRGLPPNVNLFEMTEIPTIDSRPLLVDGKEDREKTVWMLFMQFRCQFSNVQN